MKLLNSINKTKKPHFISKLFTINNEKKTLWFTILFESCVNAIVFYTLFAIIEFKFISKITNKTILNFLKEHDILFRNELLGLEKNTINDNLEFFNSLSSDIKDVTDSLESVPNELESVPNELEKSKEELKTEMKENIFKGMGDTGLDSQIETQNIELGKTMALNLKSTFIIISPLIIITLLLLFYYYINNKYYTKNKIKLEWTHIFITVFFIGFLITCYEAFIVNYYLLRTEYSNPYSAFYLWARGKHGTDNDGKFGYGRRGYGVDNYAAPYIVEKSYNIPTVNKFCNDKKNDMECLWKECISKHMCDNISNNNKELTILCNNNKNNGNEKCFAT
jgi:hypothetical protein